MSAVRPFDRALPGFSPAYTRTEVQSQGDGFWTVTHVAGDGPGWIVAADIDRYTDLAWDEVLDVLGAIYDGYVPA